MQTAPEARRDIKRVLDQYVGLQDRIAFFDSLQRPESREGFAAFIEKRSPNWVPEALRRDGRARRASGRTWPPGPQPPAARPPAPAGVLATVR